MLDEKYFEAMVSRQSFNTWFERYPDGSNKWLVIDGKSGNTLGSIEVTDGNVEVIDGDIDPTSDWLLFSATRPERLLGESVPINDKSNEENIENYEKLMFACVLEKYHEKFAPEQYEKYAGQTTKALLTWLRATDFYKAPASSFDHDSVYGGLLYHSLNVYNSILDVIKLNKFDTVSVLSAAITSLVHDWCKIGLYESYNRNVKNEDTGKWEQVLSYRINQTGAPLGHGTTSMFLASKFFQLTLEEASAIRWHMGEYNVAHNEMNELHKANESFPLCYALQFADRLSCVKY